jgi:hypothetical protein
LTRHLRKKKKKEKNSKISIAVETPDLLPYFPLKDIPPQLKQTFRHSQAGCGRHCPGQTTPSTPLMDPLPLTGSEYQPSQNQRHRTLLLRLGSGCCRHRPDRNTPPTLESEHATERCSSYGLTSTRPTERLARRPPPSLGQPKTSGVAARPPHGLGVAVQPPPSGRGWPHRAWGGHRASPRWI